MAQHNKEGRNICGVGVRGGVQGLAKGVSGEGRATADRTAKGICKTRNTYFVPVMGWALSVSANFQSSKLHPNWSAHPGN